MPLVIEGDAVASRERGPMGLRYAWITAVFALAFASAASAEKSRSPDSYMNEGGGTAAQADDAELDKHIAESDKLLALDDEKPDAEDLAIPMEINNRVAAWIHHFTQRDRERTVRYFQRGHAFKRQLEKMLEQNDVPKEIYFLAMIESGFVKSATSHAEAVGIWQLIPGTAKNYGLKVNKYVDERLHWIKSTEAAITYLKDLRNVFGSWYLAFAAYNAGEYRIVRSIMDGKTRDFWTLAEGNMLPVETLNYVPKFMAAMIIGRDPGKYGIDYAGDAVWEDFDVVEVPSGVKLKDLARVTGLSLATIKEWNPDILRGVVPYDRSGKFEMYIRKADLAKFEAKKDAIASLKRMSFGNVAMYDSARDFAIYVVRRGDTLSSVARTLGVSPRALKRLNRLARDRLHPGQRLRYLNAINADNGKFRTHVVKLNESLHTIAKKHKVTAEQIMAANNMKDQSIVPGQKLRIPLTIAAREHGREPGSRANKRGPGSVAGGNTYTVRKGDTWGAIAKRYGTSAKRLQKLNKLGKNDLHPGKKLRID